jgi:hypothetical protein
VESAVIEDDAAEVERLDDLITRMIAALELAEIWLNGEMPPSEVLVEIQSVIAEAKAEL